MDVDNRKHLQGSLVRCESAEQYRVAHHNQSQQVLTRLVTVKYFLISAPVDWEDNKYIKRHGMPTGEYVACVLWCVIVAFQYDIIKYLHRLP